VVEDTVITGLRTRGLLQIWGPVLKHVRLKGRLGRLMISDVHDPSASPSSREAFRADNRDRYADIDWAIDISEAEFEEADLRGVPGGLVRRDPETQVLVRRAALLDGRWRRVPLEDTWWGVALETLLLDGRESEVLVAPRRHPKFPKLRDGLDRLRDAGIAE
jgi:hypothetical protein